jgi:YbgC/YbaW family acyl-CoA thioester hydrolase
MTSAFTFTRRVEFAETDMAGIMHFSNYFRFMEAAEHAFFRSLGLTVHESTPTAMRGWARVHATCDYLAPLRYQDEVEVRLTVLEKGSSSLTYGAEFHRLDPDGGEAAVVARGRWTVACVSRDDDGALRSAPIPEDVDAKVEATSEGKDD